MSSNQEMSVLSAIVDKEEYAERIRGFSAAEIAAHNASAQAQKDRAAADAVMNAIEAKRIEVSDKLAEIGHREDALAARERDLQGSVLALQDAQGAFSTVRANVTAALDDREHSVSTREANAQKREDQVAWRERDVSGRELAVQEMQASLDRKHAALRQALIDNEPLPPTRVAA